MSHYDRNLQKVLADVGPMSPEETERAKVIFSKTLIGEASRAADAVDAFDEAIKETPVFRHFYRFATWLLNKMARITG